jgi:hypothetical protein
MDRVAQHMMDQMVLGDRKSGPDERISMTFRIGLRVRHAEHGHRGVVRYVGPMIETLPAANASENHHQLWVGVEWDEPVGRNDGTVRGHRYFSCSPLCGSLVKQGAKLAPGLSLVAALADRYSVGYESSCRTHGSDPFFRDPAKNMAFVNVKSADAAASADLLAVECAVAPGDESLLWGSGRSNGEEESEHSLSEQGGFILGTLFPNITAVNLNKTLVCDWAVVAQLCLALPKLKTLGVASNRFDLQPEESLLTVPSENATLREEAAACEALGAPPLYGVTPWSTSLTSLDVWSTHLSRRQWMDLVAACPCLAEIHAGCNPSLFTSPLQKDDGPSCFFHRLPAQVALRVGAALSSNLKFVSFEKSDVATVDEVVRFLLEGIIFPQTDSQLSLSLEGINLSCNSLKSLSFCPATAVRMQHLANAAPEDAEESASGVLASDTACCLFRHVRHLLLRHNLFAEWDDVTEPLLVYFPSICELHLSHCPAITVHHANDDPPALRKKMIAILPPSLTKLNNSVVTPNERFGIERFALLEYLAPYQRKCDQLGGPPPAGSPCNEEALAALQLPRGVQRFVRKILEDQFRATGNALTVHVPKPRFLQMLISVNVISLSMTLADMLQKRLGDGFYEEVLAHQKAWTGKTVSATSVHRANCDVRWTVGELEAFLIKHVGLSNVQRSAGARGSDFWSFADLLLRRFISTPADSSVARTNAAVVDRTLPVNADTLFPRGSVVLFHVDCELMENEGARARGMHCKHLVRHEDKLHQFKCNEGDAFVVVTLV